MSTSSPVNRILLVDDNPSILEDYRKILLSPDDDQLAAAEEDLFGVSRNPRPLAQFELHSALQGQQALAMVEDVAGMGRRFSMAFVDVRMPPGWNGIETIKRLWQVDPELDVVICTAFSDYSWREIAEELGSTDQFLILKKPFESVEVRQLALALTAKATLKHSRADRLAELESAFQERSAELLIAKNAAEAAARAKSEFLANMSHEIRTPLTAILGFVDLLGEGGDVDRNPQRRQETIEVIRSAGEHLLAIVNDVLDLSKIQAERMSIERVEIETAQLLTSVQSLMSPRAIGKGITLEIKLDTPIPSRVLTDPTRVRQVLMNLLGNAVKFTENGGVTVRVSAEDRADEVLLRVAIEDTGLGMTSEQSRQLFAAFGQADATVTRKYGGTGLGLVICQRLARLMGGDVELTRTEQGRGSIFTATFLVGRIASAGMTNDVSAVTHAPARRNSAAAVRLSGRILLAEDGPDNQRLIAFHLVNAGAEVDVADNGRIALEMISKSAPERPYALLLTDVQMPEMDGYALARTLRQQGSTLPIVALTAHASADDRQECLNAGCDDFATKPIDKVALLQMCRKWMLAQLPAELAAASAIPC